MSDQIKHGMPGPLTQEEKERLAILRVKNPCEVTLDEQFDFQQLRAREEMEKRGLFATA